MMVMNNSSLGSISIDSNPNDAVMLSDKECGELVATDNYRFWCDGILVSIIGCIGFVGNLLALVVLWRPNLRDVFHQLLFALACFDILYIVCGGISYTFRAFNASSDVYTLLFPYFIYPFSHISMAGTIFTTLAISIERYLGLCHPLLPPHSRKAWMYIVPVVVVSVALNIPKFLEVELVFDYNNVTNQSLPAVRSSDMRWDENYIRGYIMWTRLFSTAVIPVTMLLYLNIRITIDLMNSTKVQRFGSARRQRKEINLCLVLLCIVVIFFCCHAARIVLDIHEFSNVEKVIQCRPWHPGHFMQTLVFFSHLLMILNSSVNFVVYCLVGHTFRRELCRALGLKGYSRVPGGVSRRSSKFEFSMSAPAVSANTTNTGNGNSLYKSVAFGNDSFSKNNLRCVVMVNAVPAPVASTAATSAATTTTADVINPDQVDTTCLIEQNLSEDKAKNV